MLVVSEWHRGIRLYGMTSSNLTTLSVLWRSHERGAGGQEGGCIFNACREAPFRFAAESQLAWSLRWSQYTTFPRISVYWISVYWSTGFNHCDVLSDLRHHMLIPVAYCAAMSLRCCILTFGCCLAAEIKPGSWHRILELFHFCSGVFFLRALQQENMQP